MRDNSSIKWKSQMSILLRTVSCNRDRAAQRRANPRSTIATTTEIYEYLRVLFFCRRSAARSPDRSIIEPPNASSIVDQISVPSRSKIIVLAPLIATSRASSEM